MQDVIKDLEALFAQGLLDASDNYQAAKNGTEVKENTTTDSGAKYSIREIIGKDGTSYGIGVYLDSTLLSGLTEDERISMVKEYIKELGGKTFTAYDNNNNAVDVLIAEHGKRFINKNGAKVRVNHDLQYRLKNNVKQEAIVLVDELIETATYKGAEEAHHPHDWLDNNGTNDWDLWKTYVQDKENSVWEASLRIANTTDGEKILYDIWPIKMVEGARTEAATTTTNKVTQPDSVVKEKFHSRENSVSSDIDEALTMQEAKQMIQRAFVIGNIKEWYDGEYKNGDEWLAAQGAEEVAMYIENEYSLQSAYLDKIPGLLNEEFYLTDVLEAYQNGTLTGKKKENIKQVNVAESVAVADPRFYAPKEVKNAVELYSVANQKVTNENRTEVNKARAQILLYAHNKGAAETLGITQRELNKKLRTWGGYSATARKISMRINENVHATNRWTGIESLSWLNRYSVTDEDVVRMVKSVEGNGNNYQNGYIARTMLALDTHIDWSWLSIKFDSYAGVNASSSNSVSKCNGYYRNNSRLVHVEYDAPNTVAHEMGHALDYQWGRDIGSGMALTEVPRNTNRVSGEVQTWFNEFKDFTDSLVASSDIRSAYLGNIKETFARFVAKFVEWTEQIATGRSLSYETSYYQDKFTESQFVRFARLLQKKSAIDAMGLTGNKLEAVNSSANAKFHMRGNPNVDRVNRVLEKENAKLKEDVADLRAMLKLQRQVTNGTKFTKTSVEAAAKMLKKNMDAKGSTKELSGLLNTFYEYIASAKELSWEDVVEQAKPAAQWLLDNEKRTVDDSYARDILRELHGSKIYLDEQQRQEAAHQFGSYDAFRKKMMGNGVLQSRDCTEKYERTFQPTAYTTQPFCASQEPLPASKF